MRRRNASSDLQSERTDAPSSDRSSTSSSLDAGFASSRGSSSSQHQSTSASSIPMLPPMVPSMTESSTQALTEAASMPSETANHASMQVAASLRSSGMLRHPASLASPLAIGTDTYGTSTTSLPPYYGVDSHNRSAYTLQQPTMYPQSVVINLNPTVPMANVQQQSSNSLSHGPIFGQYQHPPVSNPLLISSMLSYGGSLPTLPNWTLPASQLPQLQLMAGHHNRNPNVVFTSPGLTSSQLLTQAQISSSTHPTAMPNLGEHALQQQIPTLLRPTQRTSNVMPPPVGLPVSSLMAPAQQAPSIAPLPHFSVLLSLPQDEGRISSYQCLVRKQIEAFNAIQDDVDSHARGRNKPIVLGQVGLRCVHCRLLPKRDLGRGSVYFPAKVERLYQAAQNMANVHLCGTCHHIPQDVKDELQLLRTQKSAVGCGKLYWAQAANAEGLINTDEGIRFKHSIINQSTG